jgi:hypothetical protein
MSFIRKCPGSFYVESNLGYYGLLDITPDVFEHHRAAYIIRDGRDWVRSTLNWGEVYGKKGIRKFFAHKWPKAKDFPDDPLAENWSELALFDKLCWAWANMNEFALNLTNKNPHARVFQFEKIFLGEERYQYLNDLIAFVTSLPDIDPEHIGNIDGWLDRKIHKSSGRFPGWDEWTMDQQRRFVQICGPLMEKYGYKIE